MKATQLFTVVVGTALLAISRLYSFLIGQNRRAGGLGNACLTLSFQPYPYCINTTICLGSAFGCACHMMMSHQVDLKCADGEESSSAAKQQHHDNIQYGTNNHSTIQTCNLDSHGHYHYGSSSSHHGGSPSQWLLPPPSPPPYDETFAWVVSRKRLWYVEPLRNYHGVSRTRAIATIIRNDVSWTPDRFNAISCVAHGSFNKPCATH